MRTLVVLALASAALTACATPPAQTPAQDTPAALCIQPDQQAQCAGEGGCSVVTQLWLRMMLQRAEAQGRAMCRGAT